jgi:hypothetical protein
MFSAPKTFLTRASVILAKARGIQMLLALALVEVLTILEDILNESF